MNQNIPEKWKSLYDAVLEGNAAAATAAVDAAIEANESPQTLVDEYMIPAMDDVGEKFEQNEYFVPELLISARAMKAALTKIQPLLTASGSQPKGRVALGTVKGDLHDIGKNLVAAMLEGGGFEVIDLGVDVDPDKFIDTARASKVDIIAMSALLTTTMPSMKTTIEALKAAGVRDGLKIMIGGAPITQEFADEIGADAYGDNASTAVSIARSLVAS